jgi:hypothetical protein
VIARRAALALVAAAAFATAACSEGALSYDGLAGLAAAVSDAGIPCDEVEPAQPARLVSRSGSCRGSEVTMFLFDDDADLAAWKKVGTAAGPAVVGPNWAVTGDRGSVATLAGRLGGERF